MKKFKLTAAAALAVAISFAFVASAFAQATAVPPVPTEKSKLDKLADKIESEVEQRLGALERETAVGKDMRDAYATEFGGVDRRLKAVEAKSSEKKCLKKVAGAVRKYRNTGDAKAFLAVEGEIRMLKILSNTMERELLSLVERVTRLEMRMDRAEKFGVDTEARVGQIERRTGESDGRHMSHERRLSDHDRAISEIEAQQRETTSKLAKAREDVSKLKREAVKVGTLVGVGFSTGFGRPEVTFGGTLRAHGAQSGFMLDLDVGVSRADSWNVSSVIMTAGGIYGSVRDTIRLWAGGFVGAASSCGLSTDRNFVGGPQAGLELRLGSYCELDVGVGPVFGMGPNSWLVTARMRCDPVRASSDLNREVATRESLLAPTVDR